MQTFTSEDLQRDPADVQRSALREPTFITVEGRPQLVMMSLDEFNRLRRPQHRVLDAASLFPGVLEELQKLADQYVADDFTLLGGLLGDDEGNRLLSEG